MDESGSRHPNHDVLVIPENAPRHFAMGGVLVYDEDESEVRDKHAKFCDTWQITYPLHSVDIRNGRKEFNWLRDDAGLKQRFIQDLAAFLTDIPVLGLACVLDRPGYDSIYRPRYGRNQWHLCKTAFSVAVERACKHALAEGRKLRVFPEHCNKPENSLIETYFKGMKTGGPPFSLETSAIYNPLGVSDLASTLYELSFKRKSSPMAQIADLYLWPIAKEGYSADRAYRALKDAGKILDCRLTDEQRSERGVKYSCFSEYRKAQQVA
jgi:hypothetical protein